MAIFDRDATNNHRDDLNGADAIEKIKELAGKIRTCFFVTHPQALESSGARPMTVLEVDDRARLWFISAIDTHKDQELQNDAHVRLYFQSSADAEFLEIRGQAFVSQDKKRIGELWEPHMNAWFDQGQDDSRVSVIEVVPEEGYYWNAYRGGVASGVRMIVGSFLLQQSHPDSAEGKLRI